MWLPKKGGCINHLVNFESFIREAIIRKENATTVFFNLEKAYDTTWKNGIMKDLYDTGLKGRMLKFINFLNDRTFRLYIGSTLSNTNKQEGVPHGRILSTTLFNIKINNIVKEFTSDINGSLYLDDCTIKNYNTA